MRVKVLVASTVTLLGLSLGLVAVPATPAGAGQPLGQYGWVAYDGDDPDHHFGLERVTMPSPYPPETWGGIVSEGYADESVFNVSSSEDRSRVIYVHDIYPHGSTTPSWTSVVVRDTGGRIVRVLEQRKWDGEHAFGDTALSPDGTRAVWALRNLKYHTYTLRKSFVGTGSPTTLHADLTPYTFLDNNTVLAQDAQGHPYTLPFTGGSLHTVNGLSVEALNVTLAPDHKHIAYGLYDPSSPDNGPYRAQLQAAPITISNGIATVASLSAKVLSTGLATGFNWQPSYSADGLTVFWINSSGTLLADGYDAPGRVLSAPADGSGTPTLQRVDNDPDVRDIAITETNGTSPGSISTIAPAVLTGTTATLGWTLPVNPVLSGTVIVRRKSYASTSDKSMYVPAPVHTYVDSQMVPGVTYVYTFTPVSRSGQYGAGTTRSVTALQSSPATFSDPTTEVSETAPFPVQANGKGAATATWQINYRVAAGPWQSWINAPNAAGEHVFGGPASTGVVATTSTPGNSYSFGTRLVDAYGNATPWAITGRAVVPYDQTSATFAGGGNVYRSDAYLGSYRKLWHATDTARITLTGNRLQIIGTLCPTCGAFDLFDNGTWVAGVNTYRSVAWVRQVLFTRSFPSVGTHAFTIRPRATPGHPDVMLDGFAMRR